jgi:hypothetical protein
MAAGEDNHKDLREVKTILQGLQRIGNHPLQVEAPGKKTGGAVTASPRAGIRPGGAESSAGRRPAQGRLLGALALAMLAAGTVIVLAGDLILKYWPGSPSGEPAAAGDGGASIAVTVERARAKTSAPASSLETSRPASRADATDVRTASAVAAAPASSSTTNAHVLMDGGHIVAARQMLLRPDLAASQEGAWLLARSYDPGYLATIPSPDASADQRRAEEWYRRWRDIAVRNGMVMDDLRLQRIIDSMRSFGTGGGSPPEGPASPARSR